jgi:hypothetical protein
MSYVMTTNALAKTCVTLRPITLARTYRSGSLAPRATFSTRSKSALLHGGRMWWKKWAIFEAYALHVACALAARGTHLRAEIRMKIRAGYGGAGAQEHG